MKAHERIFVAMDTSDAERARALARALAGRVGGFKVGLELFTSHGPSLAAELLGHGVPVFLDLKLHDIRKIKNPPSVDLVCGGFPCQDLSLAGKRAGLAGSRSGLFYEIVRFVGQVKPAWVLLENVPGLLSSNGGRDFAAVLEELGGMRTFIYSQA